VLQPSASIALKEYPSARYIAPFAAFLIFLAVSPRLPMDARWEAPLRVIVLAVLCWVCWPHEIALWPSRWIPSIAIGAAVFALWIAPEVLVAGYRDLPLFSNRFIGHTHSSLQPEALRSAWVLGWRTVRAVVIVPIVEELFWRAWLMRWLIRSDFWKVPLGTYAPLSFWLTAILFASEHGPYWDVGLLAGIVYNLWMIRTKSVADCVLMHAVTNALLSGYVIATHNWQYWQ
jgi:CAAX prenyl protease-like protein